MTQTVLTVDPAMGTGTYLQTILEHVARQTAQIDGPGAVAGAVTQAAERLVGFEIQMGPYAVAELRTADMLASHGATAPAGGMHLYVTDTLDDPHAAQTQIGYGLQLIAASRRKANKVKAKANVTVVIGNPPYKELAVGEGGWVEQRRTGARQEDTGNPGGLLRRRGRTVQGQTEEPLHLLLALGDLEGLGVHARRTRR